MEGNSGILGCRGARRRKSDDKGGFSVFCGEKRGSIVEVNRAGCCAQGWKEDGVYSPERGGGGSKSAVQWTTLLPYLSTDWTFRPHALLLFV